MNEANHRVSPLVWLAALALSCNGGMALAQSPAKSSPNESKSGAVTAQKSPAPATPRAADRKTGKSGANAAVLVVVPLDWSEQSIKKEGCWATLYDGKNYTGDSFMLAGRQDLPEMKGPFGFNWQNKVKSIETGAKATVTIFDNRNFKDRDKVIAPGTKVPDLSKKMGFFDDFRSMKMACSG